MDLKPYAFIVLLIFLAAIAFAWNTNSGPAPTNPNLAQPTIEQGGFEIGKTYRVETAVCDTTLTLFELAREGPPYLVTPDKFCLLDKEFKVLEKKEMLISIPWVLPNESIFQGPLKLEKVVRIQWEVTPGIFQEAYVEEIKALDGSQRLD